MKKRIAFLLLCAFLFALLAGCGKDTGSPQTDSSSDSQTQSQADGQINGRTLFIYMCGSNLESRQGLASKNIDELLSANVSSDLNIVLQTGGAKTWRHHGISATQSQRYEIKDKKLTLLEELDQKNMGSAETLTDFLKWGQEKYPTSHNMLILWDHGGGSVKGVCFDENYNMDSLSLTELRTAFKDANLRQKFDILGFDACLMASLETAAITQDYAEYMIASEEIVPGGGWDYKTVAEACESGKNEIEIGRKICDSFMEKCKANEKELYSTLSVFDLAYTDPMLQCLVKAADNLFSISGKQNAFSQILTAAYQSEKFGIDTVFEGSSNMVDFVSFNELVNIWEYFALTERMDFVVYSVNGGNREVSGVSFFFPLTATNDEIAEYLALGICDRYNEFLSSFYYNPPEEPIRFKDKGSLTKNSSFRIQLTEESKKYLTSVHYLILETDNEGKQHILYAGVDTKSDWENLTFTSKFKGRAPAFNNHRVYSELHADREGFLDFEVPAIVNDKSTYIRYMYLDERQLYLVYGTCVGYDENKLPVNSFEALNKGDRVRVATDLTVDGRQLKVNYGEEFTLDADTGEITELPLTGDSYQYVFILLDNFGNFYYSDVATFVRDGEKFKAVETAPLSIAPY